MAKMLPIEVPKTLELSKENTITHLGSRGMINVVCLHALVTTGLRIYRVRVWESKELDSFVVFFRLRTVRVFCLWNCCERILRSYDRVKVFVTNDSIFPIEHAFGRIA